jgi:hypothetical protein
LAKKKRRYEANITWGKRIEETTKEVEKGRDAVANLLDRRL